MKKSLQGFGWGLAWRFGLVLLLAGTLLVPTTVLQAEDEGGVSAWNPMTWSRAFSSKPTPEPKKPTPKASSTPSTWSRISRNTKSFANSTQYTLMPWTKPTKPSPAPLTGSRVTKSKSGTNSKSSSSSWWMPSWMSGSKDDKDPETVTDWVGKSRPDF